MRNYFTVIFITLLVSCGGVRDISVKLNGRYIGLDEKSRKLYYGLEIGEERNFSLWYIDNSGELQILTYTLDNLEIENLYRYNFESSDSPTWIYSYSGADAPFDVVIHEFRDGSVTPNIEFKSLEADSADNFKQTTSLMELTESYPEIFNLPDNIDTVSIPDLYSKIYSCEGIVIGQGFKKQHSLLYAGVEAMFIETTTIMVKEGILNIEFQGKYFKEKPDSFTYNIGDTVSQNIKIRSYQYISDDKKGVVLKGELKKP